MDDPLFHDDNPWTLSFDGWRPADEGRREALCTLANGYMGVRGALEAGSGASYPALYLAGCYDRNRSRIAGEEFEHEDLVRLPAPLDLAFAIEEGVRATPEACELAEYAQALDLRQAALARRLRLRDGQGRETLLESRRIVHMEQPHLCALQWRLTPLNWSGGLRLSAGLDGGVVNEGSPPGFAGWHLEVLSAGAFALAGAGGEGIELRVRTQQSRREVALAARLRLLGASEPAVATVTTDDRSVTQTLRLPAAAGRALTIEKVVAVYSSKDSAISEPGLAARLAAARADDFDALYESHRTTWNQLWRRCDLRLSCPAPAQRALRLNLFHLLQTLSPNTIDLDVGVPARGWHGEAYRGHAFWDELFVFPYLNLHLPDISRALLMYRYRRLPEARHRARAAGLRGACYPWRSASSGREETAPYHFNPRSGRWLRDDTHLQRHVNAAIAYNVWQYYQATEDREFLARYGAEMVLEIARLWANSARWCEQSERYEIHGVVGPDEFHTRYPHAPAPGLNNNAYTNVMAAWCLRCAERVLAALSAADRDGLLERLAIGEEERAAWRRIRRRLKVPYLQDGIIAPFDGWENLKAVDWEGLRRRHGQLTRIDHVLEAEGDDVNRYQVAKQADVLMLFYLFSAHELRALLAELGHELEPQAVQANIDYHTRHTTHASTLSRVVHAWVHARADRSAAWHWFDYALHTDIGDSAASTAGGVHLGAMAGSIDLLQRCFLGVGADADQLAFDLRLPQELGRIEMQLRYRGAWLRVSAAPDELALRLDADSERPLIIRLHDHEQRLSPGDDLRFCKQSTAGGGQETARWQKA
jgi:alpha,alpha-trehalase